MFLGGEAISSQRLVSWQDSPYYNAIISNVYGVAECSDVSSFYELSDYEKYNKSSVPAGIPIYNNDLYIVDDDKNLLPLGAVGEIGIAGIGLGFGYRNDEELTKQKFTTLANGTKVYLTGDLGKLMNGMIEFYGRKDYQVKVRGNRIELGDIENAMRQMEFVKEAVVVYDSDKEKLNAYIERKEDNTEKSKEEFIHDIYQGIKSTLPSYMIPDYIYLVEKLPMNQHGKIDRIALLKSNAMDMEEFTEYQLDGKQKYIHDQICELL